jgi:hypothetical protein
MALEASRVLREKRTDFSWVVGTSLVLMSANGRAQTSPEASANQLAVNQGDPNPFTETISVPIENDFNFGVGPGGDPKDSLRLKPVFPAHFFGEWHIFQRPIVQIVAQPAPKPGEDGAFGLGDLEYQLYVSPPSTHDFIWGVGADLWFPTGTATALGSGKSSAGAAGAFRLAAGPWMVGIIATQYWSYAGDPNRSSVSQMSLQPLLFFNFPAGWYLTSSPIVTADWKAASGDVWTIPIGGGVGKHFGADSAMNVQAQAFYNVAEPAFAGRWQIRLVFQILLPREAR